MKTLYSLFAFTFCISGSFAQFVDNFDNGTFPNDPAWFGDTGIYEVNILNELQLMDIDEGQSFIYAPVSTADSTNWEFYFRLEFDPSATNRLKIFLSSDSPDLSGNLNGYYLQIGQSGSDDALELYRQDGSASTLILSGTAAAVGTEPAVRVQVIRNDDGLWQLFADYSGGTDLIPDGTVIDNSYPESNYFGFHCNYSLTRKDKFYFDDISIGPLAVDETPPALLSVAALNTNTIQVNFDESLDQSSAENILNYQIDNGISVVGAGLDSDPSSVILSVSTLSSGQMYELTALNMEDQNGNIAATQSGSFTYFELEEAAPFDLLINEIYPKPDPAISSLPDAEFFELYNRSDKTINLEGFEIADAANSKILPSYILLPQSYLIICDDEFTGSYLSFGPVLGIPGLFKLNDGGDDLSISNNSGVLIDSISFDDNWYQDESKDDGGWSIELANPQLYCRGASNWRASLALNGGTPGQENSIFDNSPDNAPPVLVDAIAINESQVRLFFNEIMSFDTESPSAYNISTTGAILSATLELPNKNTVLITIENPFFENGNSYTITANTEVTDCSGVSIGIENSAEFSFFQTQEAERYDILINEIFPDPSPAIGLPEKEFIELYNRSEKAINLENFLISVGSDEILLPFHLLLPDSHVIIYGNGEGSYSAYGDTIVFSFTIGLTNESGKVELVNPQGDIIHAISYDVSWYKDSGKQNGGWTLELINPDNPCEFRSNWRASVNGNGGTPGSPNSVLEQNTESTFLDLIKAFPYSSNQLVLQFNKAIDEATASDITNYSVEGLSIVDALAVPPLYDLVLLTFGDEIADGTVYEIMVKNELTDCAGNEPGMFNSAKFANPQAIDIQDIVINEVLFNPETGGVRFLEIYNRSEKTFDISELVIASRNLETNEIEKPEPVDVRCLLFPGQYIVLTPSPGDIYNRYFTENPYALVQTDLPSYDDKEGTVLIYIPEILGITTIDEFEYSNSYHNALLDDENGVSLERIDPEGETNDPNNWHSAAKSVGFATPTYLNSQFVRTQNSGSDIFTIDNNTLSPDGDGFEDFLLVNYQIDKPGYLVNIRIFDARGRLVKTLVNNELLASQGSFKWDGETDDNRKSRIGIYIVWIEI